MCSGKGESDVHMQAEAPDCEAAACETVALARRGNVLLRPKYR